MRRPQQPCTGGSQDRRRPARPRRCASGGQNHDAGSIRCRTSPDVSVLSARRSLPSLSSRDLVAQRRPSPRRHAPTSPAPSHRRWRLPRLTILPSQLAGVAIRSGMRTRGLCGCARELGVPSVRIRAIRTDALRSPVEAVSAPEGMRDVPTTSFPSRCRRACRGRGWTGSRRTGHGFRDFRPPPGATAQG